jgi:hypothetical protein
MTNYCRVQGVPTHSRPHLMALGILQRRIHDPRRFGEFDRVGLAKKVFGDAAIEEASNRVAETLTKWLANCYFSSHRAYNALHPVAGLARIALVVVDFKGIRDG